MASYSQSWAPRNKVDSLLGVVVPDFRRQHVIVVRRLCFEGALLSALFFESSQNLEKQRFQKISSSVGVRFLL